MTIEKLEEIWKEFGINQSTTNLIVDKINSLGFSWEKNRNLNRIVFTIELLMWICDDPLVAQSIESNIAPRSKEEFIVSFLKNNKNEYVRKVNVLESIITPMNNREKYLCGLKQLTNEEELEIGDTENNWNNLIGDMHTLCGALNYLRREIKDEYIKSAAEATIDINEFAQLPLTIQRKRNIK